MLLFYHGYGAKTFNRILLFDKSVSGVTFDSSPAFLLVLSICFLKFILSSILMPWSFSHLLLFMLQVYTNMLNSLQPIVIRSYFSGLYFDCLFVPKQNACFSNVSLKDSVTCFTPFLTTDNILLHDISAIDNWKYIKLQIFKKVALR